MNELIEIMPGDYIDPTQVVAVCTFTGHLCSRPENPTGNATIIFLLGDVQLTYRQSSIKAKDVVAKLEHWKSLQQNRGD